MPSHKQLSHWYAQVGQHLEAGILISEAFRMCDGMPTKGRFAMAESLERGETFNHVMAHAPAWLPKADRQFLVAGMETGSLPRTFSNLAVRDATIGATQLKIMLGLTYPMAVLHIVAMLLPVVRMIDYESGVDWNFTTWLQGSLTLLVPIWLIIALLLYLARSHSPLLPRLLRVLPILRRYSLAQSMADLAYSLATFIAAGVPVPSAWRLSVKIVNDARFIKACKQMEPVFATGQDPSAELKHFACFPSDFAAFYRTGAQSGKLDENLFIAGRQYQDRANHAMTLASIVYPSLVFAVVAAIIISTIFKIYSGYLDIFDTL